MTDQKNESGCAGCFGAAVSMVVMFAVFVLLFFLVHNLREINLRLSSLEIQHGISGPTFEQDPIGSELYEKALISNPLDKSTFQQNPHSQPTKTGLTAGD